MPAGSVIVFDGALVHRGGANTSNADRLAITPQYCNPGLRQIENMVLSVPPSIAGNCSERIQNMLGYSIIEPSFMGYVDGVHPRKLIDRSTKAANIDQNCRFPRPLRRAFQLCHRNHRCHP